jgi:hypothetical protein
MIRRAIQAAVLGLAVLVAAAPAQAADEVSVRHRPGYPLPGRSVESIEISIKRIAPSQNTQREDVDRFFSQVEATLAEYGIVRDWQLVIPDAPYIEIVIHLSGRRTRLASAHVDMEKNRSLVVTERGVETLGQQSRAAVLSQQSEELRRHRLAFERILGLSLERGRAVLSP